MVDPCVSSFRVHTNHADFGSVGLRWDPTFCIPNKSLSWPAVHTWKNKPLVYHSVETGASIMIFLCFKEKFRPLVFCFCFFFPSLLQLNEGLCLVVIVVNHVRSLSIQLKCTLLKDNWLCVHSYWNRTARKKRDLIEHSRHPPKSQCLIIVGPTQQGHRREEDRPKTSLYSFALKSPSWDQMQFVLKRQQPTSFTPSKVLRDRQSENLSSCFDFA